MITAQTLIVTFYAFKGGTGRTLAVANVARYLAEERGYRVGLIDLDLESPGLSHEPLSPDLDLANVASSPEAERKKDKLTRRIDGREGFVELFTRYMKRSQEPNGGLPDAVSDTKSDEELREIDQHVVSFRTAGNGSIVLMSAAKGSIFKSPDFKSAVDEFQKTLSRSLATDADTEARIEQLLEEGKSAPQFQSAGVAQKMGNLLKNFGTRYDLDFLFLDGRTGAGQFSPIYLYSVPHLLVLLLSLNDQNVRGSLDVLKSKTSNKVPLAPVYLVASPVPTVGPRDLEDRLRFITQQLSHLKQDREEEIKASNNIADVPSESTREAYYIYTIPDEVHYMLPYSDAAAYGENYFPGSYPHSSLAREYRRLADGIEKLVLRSEEGKIACSDAELVKSMKEPPAEPGLIVAAENVHWSNFQRLFHKIPKISPETEIIEKVAKLTMGSIRFDLYPSDDDDAPWERLFKGGRWEDSVPDVLIIPQIYLASLAAPERELLTDLTSERDRQISDGHRNSSPQNRIFDYDFLDSVYPHWRRWCAVKSRVFAVPFSINTMFFCANKNLLRKVSHYYWNERGQSDGAFLPSSWLTLTRMLEAFCAARSKSNFAPFGLVASKRGRYYDWLNIIHALGGFDVREAEGRVPLELGLATDKALEATELYRKISNLVDGWEWPRFDKQIEAFAQQKLAFYVAWTDSFNFSWKGDHVEDVRPVTIPTQTRAAQQNFEIRFGQLPRDMRYPRALVVDGWVMTFPRKDALSNQTAAQRKKRSFDFADYFLSSERQFELVREGFPTNSLSVIQRELEDVETRRGRNPAAYKWGEQCYETFLRTLQSAITSGVHVPSLRSKMNSNIVELLHPILSEKQERGDLGEQLSAIEREMKSIFDGQQMPSA